MKRLLLLRHAKSSHDDNTLQDVKRPLNERGRDDANLVGKHIRQQKILPDLILSSPAKRARQTISLVTKAAGLKRKPKFDEGIYDASGRRLHKIVTGLDDSVNSALLVGHNPGFEELLRSLTGKDRSLPTASLACIEFETEHWSELRSRSGKLKWRVTPRKLKRSTTEKS